MYFEWTSLSKLHKLRITIQLGGNVEHRLGNELISVTLIASGSSSTINIHIMLYVGWGKDSRIDGSYMQCFECKKFQ